MKSVNVWLGQRELNYENTARKHPSPLLLMTRWWASITVINVFPTTCYCRFLELCWLRSQRVMLTLFFTFTKYMYFSNPYFSLLFRLLILYFIIVKLTFWQKFSFIKICIGEQPNLFYVSPFVIAICYFIRVEDSLAVTVCLFNFQFDAYTLCFLIIAVYLC